MIAAREVEGGLKSARAQFLDKRLGPAEIICRKIIEAQPQEHHAMELLGKIARRIGKLDHAETWFRRAGTTLPASGRESHHISLDRAARAPRYLLIKAWGYGFFADVYQVLGSLRLAEMTGRIPVVHWGGNSLFGGNGKQDAFSQFYAPLNGAVVDDLTAFDRSEYFPPKWSGRNLADDNVQKWQGRHSRMAGLNFFNRRERVAVSDFFIGVPELVPWFERDDPNNGKTLNQVFMRLVATYLHPRRNITEAVDAFTERELAGAPFVAVHMRGSDKSGELARVASNKIQDSQSS